MASSDLLLGEGKRRVAGEKRAVESSVGRWRTGSESTATDLVGNMTRFTDVSLSQR